MTGPPPKPTQLKLLRGNPGHQRLNKFEPQPEIFSDPPEAPPFLTGYAADEWWRIVHELHRLKLVTPIDVNVLAAYCQAYKRWRTAEETLARMANNDPLMNGLIVKSGAGTAMQNPLVHIADKAANAMVRYASEFGLTPAARSRIVSTDAQTQAVKKFDGLLAAG